MKADGIKAWLKHWLKLQKKGKHPLVLRGPSDSSPNAPLRKARRGKPRDKKGKARYIEVEDSDEEEVNDGLKSDGMDEDGSTPTNSNPANEDTAGLEVKVLPPSPHSASKNRSTRRTFLASLSADLKYKKLMLLLHVAKVSEHTVPKTLADGLQDGEASDESRPAWISWKSKDHYLLEEFYDPSAASSYSEFKRWIQNDPITVGDNKLASYDQIELVILGFGLAFRGIWIVQFEDQYRDVPSYISDSGYPFSEYEQLGHLIDDLLSGCAEV